MQLSTQTQKLAPKLLNEGVSKELTGYIKDRDRQTDRHIDRHSGADLSYSADEEHLQGKGLRFYGSLQKPSGHSTNP